MAPRRSATAQNVITLGRSRPGSLKWWVALAGIVLALLGTYCARYPHGLPGGLPGGLGSVTGAGTPAPSPTGVAYAGLPKGADVQVLENDGFTDGFSATEGVPLWAAYRATDPRQGAVRPRPETFSHDPRAPASADTADYAGSGYDRGHMAPNSIISRLYGETAQRETFLTSNIAPQTPRLNQLAWQRLEEAEANQLAPRLGTVWVTLGPVIAAADGWLARGRVRVPHAFYRIWLARDERSGALSALAFIMPQAVRGDEDLSQFVVTVDEIERQTGLDFFAELDDTTEAALESTPADGRWQLAHFARAAGRYARGYRDRPGAALGNGRFAPRRGQNAAAGGGGADGG